MDALILGAGYAKRMWPLTKDQAKPLLPVAGRPVVRYVIERLRTAPGLKKLWLVTNARFANDFRAFARRSRLGASLTVLSDGTRDEAHRLGAIGDLRLAIQRAPIRNDLVVVGGDNLFTFELAPFIRFAQAHRPFVTMGVVDLGSKRRVAKRYGVVRLGRGGVVEELQEKPARPKTSLAALCLYWFDRRALSSVEEYLGTGQNPDAPGHLIAWLVKRRQVYGFRFAQGLWYDIGNLAVYERAQQEFRQ